MQGGKKRISTKKKTKGKNGQMRKQGGAGGVSQGSEGTEVASPRKGKLR